MAQLLIFLLLIKDRSARVCASLTHFEVIIIVFNINILIYTIFYIVILNIYIFINKVDYLNFLCGLDLFCAHKTNPNNKQHEHLFLIKKLTLINIPNPQYILGARLILRF